MGNGSRQGRALLALGAALWTEAFASGQTLIHHTVGLAVNEHQGTSVTVVGDIDGDGRAEFAVGAPGTGVALGLVRMYSGASGSLMWQIVGPSAGSTFGASIAALGDVNGDGVPDLVIGAPLATVPGATGCGIVRVVSGTDGATLFQFRGDAAGDHMGWSVARAGDIDHDGVPDIIGGAVDDDDHGESTGSARVWSGANGAVIETLVGGLQHELFGYSVDGGADVNGDGTSDIVVGGPYFTTSTQGGVVRVLSGATGSQLWSTPFAPAHDALGSAVAFVGDIDGDGRSDVLAGARQPSTGGVGYVRLYSGATGAMIRQFTPDGMQRSFGFSVTGLGDVDFDNVPDFAIGAPDSSTGGTLSGVVRWISGATGNVLEDHVGVPGARLGSAVRGGGDIDGDGWPDLVGGAPGESASGTGSGAAYAFRGSDELPPDSDGDGVPDFRDGCPYDAHKIAPGACGCGVSDVDSDGDGAPDCTDGCPNDATKLASGACGCGVADTDADGDGTPDCNDGCPNDPNKISPGVCGCNSVDVDSDGDGTLDCNDGCPSDPHKVSPGTCGCNVADADSDGDGVLDCNDGCPNDPGKIAPGRCGCGVGEMDSDGDGFPNCVDGCSDDPSKASPGVCGCGVSDVDSDNDGTPDCQDGCPDDPLKLAPGLCGCGRPDTDANNDGVPDCNVAQHDPLEADVQVISFDAHGVQHLTLRAGVANAGRHFVMMGSLSGTQPGFMLDHVHVPLRFDRYTAINLLPCYPSPIEPVMGVLDSNGEAHVEIDAERMHGRAFWVGQTIHHAFIVLDRKHKAVFASNAVRVKIAR